MPELVRLDFFFYAFHLQQFRYWYTIDRRVALEQTLAHAVSALIWALSPSGDLKKASRQDIADMLGIDKENLDAMYTIPLRCVELGLISDNDDTAADLFINRLYETRRQWSIRNDLRFYRPKQKRNYQRNIAIYILGVLSEPIASKADLAGFFRITPQQVTNIIDEISIFLAVRHGLPIMPRKPEPSPRTVESWHRFRLKAFEGNDPIFIAQYRDAESHYRKTRIDQTQTIPGLQDPYWLKPTAPPSWFTNWFEERITEKSIVYENEMGEGYSIEDYTANLDYNELDLLAGKEDRKLQAQITKLLQSIPSLDEVDDPFSIIRKCYPQLVPRRRKLNIS